MAEDSDEIPITAFAKAYLGPCQITTTMDLFGENS